MLEADRRLVYSIVVIFAVIAAEFAFFLMTAPAPSFQKCSYAESNQDGSEAQQRNTERTISVPGGNGRGNEQTATNATGQQCTADPVIAGFTYQLARYTAYLVGATVLLGIFGAFQAWISKRGIDLTREEFNATFRPHIRVHSIKFHPPEINEDANLEQVGARVIYANDGGQDAVIEEIRFSFAQRQIPLESDILLRGNAVLPRVPIKGGVHGWFEISAEQNVGTVKLISDGTSRFFLIGRIVYRSPRGATREMGFCRQLVWSSVKNFQAVDFESGTGESK